MADPRLPVPPMDIVGIFSAAQQMREGRLREQAQRAKLEDIYAARQRESAAREAWATGGAEALAKLDPQAALAVREKQLDIAAREVKPQEERLARTSDFMQRAAAALQSDPAAAPRVAALKQSMVGRGLIDDFDIGVDDQGRVTAQALAATAALGGKKPDQARVTPGIIEYEYAQANPAFAQARTAEEAAKQAAEADRVKRDQAEKLLDNEMKFAKDVRADKAIEALRTSEAAYARATSAMDNAAGDAVMLMGLAQLMLPGEAINEGDVGRLQARGIPGHVVAAIQSTKQNRALLPGEREGFKAQIEALRKRNMISASPYVQAFRRQASEFGFDVNRVMPKEIYGAIKSYDDADAELDQLRGGK